MIQMRSCHHLIFPVQLEHRLNYFGFYSDSMTKNTLDRIKEQREAKYLMKDNEIIPSELKVKIQGYLKCLREF